jgi:hypothetical protein
MRITNHGLRHCPTIVSKVFQEYSARGYEIEGGLLTMRTYASRPKMKQMLCFVGTCL